MEPLRHLIKSERSYYYSAWSRDEFPQNALYIKLPFLGSQFGYAFERVHLCMILPITILLTTYCVC